MNSLLERLRQRKLIQWSIAYLAGAWVLLQVLEFLRGQFDWPAAIVRALTVFLAVAFLAVLVLAWYHGERGRQRVTAVEAVLIAAILMSGVAAAALVTRSGEGAKASVPAAAIQERSVAVLPFRNMSGSAENEYFSDGITEEILNALAKVPDLRVPARTSSFHFKGKDLPISDIARQLNVAHILEGSVRRDGIQVRITAQLIEAATDKHLWSAQYDRELKDVFAIQGEIARAIANQLEVTLAATAAGKHVPDPEAYDLYLRARALWAKRGRENMRQAIGLFESAAARDPQFGGAHAGLALALAIAPDYGAGDSTALAAADRSARRALALDTTLADAHAALGYAAFARDRRDEAEASYRKALSLDPDNPNTLIWYQLLLRAQWRYPEAEQMSQRAAELDPLSPVAWWSVAGIMIELHRPPEAVAAARRAFAADTTSAVAARYLTRAFYLAGLPDSALAVAERGVRLEPDSRRFDRVLSYVYAANGRRQDAELAFSRLGIPPKAPSIPRSQLYVALGKPDSALAVLEAIAAIPAGQQPSPAGAAQRPVRNRFRFLCDPEYDPIAAHPRFTALTRRVDLSPCPGRKR